MMDDIDDNDYFEMSLEEKKNLKKIFERFWQEDRANETMSVKGSGIGLSYADDIINRHGGKISVESTPDISTVFNITLDRCEAIDINMAVCSTDEEENTLSEADIPQQSTTVLIVEDNHEVMQVLKHISHLCSGHSVIQIKTVLIFHGITHIILQNQSEFFRI